MLCPDGPAERLHCVICFECPQVAFACFNFVLRFGCSFVRRTTSTVFAVRLRPLPGPSVPSDPRAWTRVTPGFCAKRKEQPGFGTQLLCLIFVCLPALSGEIIVHPITRLESLRHDLFSPFAMYFSSRQVKSTQTPSLTFPHNSLETSPDFLFLSLFVRPS